MEKRKKMIILAEAVICSLSLMIFSYFIQYDFPQKSIALLALLVAAYLISKSIKSVNDLKNIFGENRSKIKVLLLIVAGILVGIALALPYRNYHDWPVIPESFRVFTLVAASIGCMEELVYRGFLQEFTKNINSTFSVLFSTLSHTGYKCFLFLAPVVAEHTDIRFLFFWTFGVGLFFGITRHFTKSIWLPLAAHIIFDALSYAEFIHSPWWVW